MHVAVQRRRALGCAGFTCTLLAASVASAQLPPPANTSAAAGATAQAAAEPAPAATPTADAAEPGADSAATDSQTPVPIAPLAAAAAADAKANRELAKVRYEQDHSSTLLPWVVTATGLALLVTGLVVGAQAALACDHSCKTPWWPGWLVVAGSSAGIAGIVWLKLEERDLAELQSRRYRLEQELERSRINAAPLPKEGPHAMLRLRVAF